MKIVNKISGNLTIERIFLMILFVVLTTLWFLISVSNYFSLRDGVYDLGASMQRAWTYTHYSLNFQTFSNVFLESPFVALFSPIASASLITVWLFLQSISLSLAVFPIYGISKHFLRKGPIALMISALYGTSIMIPGLYFVDFHYQVFFPVLFLFAYYFYIKKNLNTSVFFFVLAAMTKYPFSIFVVLFVIVELFSALINRKSIDQHQKRHLLITGSLSFFLVLGGYFLVAPVASVVSTNPILGYSIFSEISNKMFTLFIFIGGLLFIPLFSNRWLPFIVLLSLTTFVGGSYAFPDILYFHHTAPWLVFLFLGFIEGMRNIFPTKTEQLTSPEKKRSVFSRKRIEPNHKAIIFLVLITILLAVLYQPISPLNKNSDMNFNFDTFKFSPSQQFKQIQTVGSLIPINTTTIIQDNMPMLMPRFENNPYSMPIVSGYGSVFPGFFNTTNIVKNAFPFNVKGINTTTINYLIGDIQSSSFTIHNPDSNSMFNIAAQLYDSGYYGLYAQDGGTFALRREYHYSPVLFEPTNITIPPSQINYSSGMRSNASVIWVNNSTIGSFQSFAIPEILLPGKYTFTQTITFSNIVSSGSVILTLQYSNGTVLNKTTILEPKYSGTKSQNASFSFEFNGIAKLYVKVFLNVPSAKISIGDFKAYESS